MIKFFNFVIIFAFFALGCNENKLEIECIENENLDMSLEDSSIKKNKSTQESIKEYLHTENSDKNLKPTQFEAEIQVEIQDFRFYTE
jgi:hypothetical protein